MRFAGPVFAREAIGLVRQRRHFVLRAAFLCGLFAFVGTAWVNHFRYSRFGQMLDYTDLPMVGHSLFETFMFVEAFAVVLIVPVIMATAVAGEKEKDTLGLLLMTNVGAWGILGSKWISRFLMVLLLILSGAPLLLGLLSFGGVMPGDILLGLLGLLGIVLFASGVSLLASTLAGTSAAAMMWTYVVFACYWGCAAFLSPDAVPPCWIPAALLSGDVQGLPFMAVSLVVFLGCLFESRVLLARHAGQTGPPFLKRVSGWLNAFYARINFTRIVVLEERELKGNPLLWKELHRTFFSSTTFVLRALAFGLGAWMVITIVALGLGADDFLYAFGGTLILLVNWIGVVVMAANAFSSDRERRALQVLLTSPVTARAIVLSRFLGLLKMLIPGTVIFMLWGMLLMWMNGVLDRDVEVLGQMLVALIVFVPGTVVIGMLCGMRWRAGTALVLTFGTLLVWCMSPVILSFGLLPDAIDWFFGNTGEWIDDTEYVLMSLAPVSAIYMVFDRYLVWPATLCLIPLWMVLLRMGVKRFDNWMGRE